MTFPQKCRHHGEISNSISHGEKIMIETDSVMVVMICCTSRPNDWIMPSRSVACTRARSRRS